MNDTVSPPARSARASARDKVLVAALELFNERGTGPVSTNHIAQRAGISPGNLYYWFDGKPAIIAALFERWSEASAPVDPADGSPEALLVALFATVDANDQRALEHRGVARELLVLLHADTALAERYQQTYRDRTAALRWVASTLVDSGMLRAPEPPGTIDDVVTAAWVLNEFSPSFVQQVEPGDGPPRTGRVSHALLRAFLTDAGRLALAQAQPRKSSL